MNEWTLDRWGCWNLRCGSAWIWMTRRPVYCDRGHWQANVNGVPSLDGQDGFPRYFMDLERAKLEMEDWLEWRLLQESAA